MREGIKCRKHVNNVWMNLGFLGGIPKMSLLHLKSRPYMPIFTKILVNVGHQVASTIILDNPHVLFKQIRQPKGNVQHKYFKAFVH